MAAALGVAAMRLLCCLDVQWRTLVLHALVVMSCGAVVSGMSDDIDFIATDLPEATRSMCSVLLLLRPCDGPVWGPRAMRARMRDAGCAARSDLPCACRCRLPSVRDRVSCVVTGLRDEW